MDWKRAVAVVVFAGMASCQMPAKPGALLGVGVPVLAVVEGDGRLASARNETVGVEIRLVPPSKERARKKLSLRVGALKSAGGGVIDAKQVTVYQVVDMPVETNGAAYVRHTGMDTTQQRMPGALLPLEVDKEGRIQLAQVRDGGRVDRVGDKEQGIGEAITLWVDVHVPAEVSPGEYGTSIELIENNFGDHVIGALPVRVGVDDFVLPDERHLLMVSRVEWETLYKHWPKEFEAITPRLLNRDEPRHAGAIHVMDEIVKLAQKNRVQVVFDRVQPTVKWPAGERPEFDWTDYDTVVGPWLSGDGFADHVPYGYWPLPKADNLDRYDRDSRMEYWQGAATHFDQKDWLGQATVLMDRQMGGNEQRRQRDVTAEAADIVRAHTKVRVTAPVPAETLDVSERAAEGRVDLANAGRVAGWGPGLVYMAGGKQWPKGIDEPKRFLAVNMNAPTPYVGVGESERDVRQWAWLAFVQKVGMVLWNEALPAEQSALAPAGAGEQVWMYPGSWFGVKEPVETVQLKWARRAAQDYEYLWLARQRGQVVSPELIAKLLSKPVEVRQGQSADPLYSLVSGTVDWRAWEEARRLVARAIDLTQAGQKPDARTSEDLRLETLRWTIAQGRPTVLARGVQWTPRFDGMLDVKLGVDLYSPSDDPAEKNSIEWAQLPAGWEGKPRPMEVPTLGANQVTHVELAARFKAEAGGLASTAAGQVDFVSGYNRVKSSAGFVLPVGVCDRHEGRIKLDGELDDWNELDAIQNGPLVKMVNQPEIRRGELEHATTPSAIYTGWGEDSFYVAFKVAGLTGTDLRSMRNFVDYQDRRAWGEDLCEMLVQGVYDGGATGPVVHLVCKPNGQWVERRGVDDADWSPMTGAGVLYAGRLEGDSWRGEVAIPWKLLNDVRRGRPGYLRFNFVQHKSATGQSASWAGPVDFGRDENWMGLLVLRGAK
ncbi:MAG TPA: hypothetical protein VFE58_00710 [Tepidisphaeraceae bacterium]|jgi:hypothetical protein|nr:hypothetical protein [Tepidisphaeraceae bacterium]